MLLRRVAVVLAVIVVGALAGCTEDMGFDVGFPPTPFEDPEAFTQLGAHPVTVAADPGGPDPGDYTVLIPMGVLTDPDFMRAFGYDRPEPPAPVFVENPDGSVGELPAGSRLVNEAEGVTWVLQAGQRIRLARGFVAPPGSSFVCVGPSDDEVCEVQE